MTQTEGKIMAMVEKELASHPKATTKELYEKAKAADPNVGKLSIRQFHARYPLQVKRRKGAKAPVPAPSRSGAAPAEGGRSARSAEGRDAVRVVFLRFAEDMAGAEERRTLVQVLGNLDQYVDDALRAARR